MYVFSTNKKNYHIFHPKITVFTAVIYRRKLHRRVIVMLYFQVASAGLLNFDGDEYKENMFPARYDWLDNIIAVFWDNLLCAQVLYRETTSDSLIMVS